MIRSSSCIVITSAARKRQLRHERTARHPVRVRRTPRRHYALGERPSHSGFRLAHERIDRPDLPRAPRSQRRGRAEQLQLGPRDSHRRSDRVRFRPSTSHDLTSDIRRHPEPPAAAPRSRAHASSGRDDATHAPRPHASTTRRNRSHPQTRSLRRSAQPRTRLAAPHQVRRAQRLHHDHAPAAFAPSHP